MFTFYFPNTNRMMETRDQELGDGDRKNNQNEEEANTGDLHAFGTAAQHPGDRDEDQDLQVSDLTTDPKADQDRLSLRDETLLRYVVCLRLLTYGQIHRLVFSNVDPSFARRRIRQLAESGWLHTWEPASRSGGHVRYAHPTQRTLRQVLPTLSGSEPLAKIVNIMLPRTKRRALQLEPGTTPKWLPHQREVNHVVSSIVTSPTRTILWASSWDSPFPPRLGMFVAPQPDYVIIEEIDGSSHLVFGEHDRGNEPIDRFVARKVALYSSLARFPEACEQHFGVRQFRVQVTVIDVARRAPVERMHALMAAARRHGGPDIFRFTLGGWLHAWPDHDIWRTPRQPLANESVAWGDHATASSGLAGILPAPA